MLKAGMCQNIDAKTVGTTQKTINILWRRFQTTGSTDDQPRSGRPKVTTPKEDRQICLLHLQNRNLSAVDSANSALESIEDYPSDSAKPIDALRFESP